MRINTLTELSPHQLIDALQKADDAGARSAEEALREALEALDARLSDTTNDYAYLVACSTGCSCCRDENHRTGPFEHRGEAEAAAADYLRYGRLGSRWAPKGRYGVIEVACEKLPDGRLIIDGRVVDGYSSDEFDKENA